MASMNSSSAPGSIVTAADLSASSSSSPSSLYRHRWLLTREELEEFLSTQSISLLELRSDKNTSELVDKVLEHSHQLRVQKAGGRIDDFSQDGGATSGAYDFLARSYLAVEIQMVLLNWAQQGLEATKKSLMLYGDSSAGFWDSEGLNSLVAYEVQGEQEEEESSAMRSRSISTTSSAGTVDSIHTIDTNISSPPMNSTGATPEDRPSKRRNMADGITQDIYISPTRGAPRLSLVTSSLFPEGSSAAQYGFQDQSANTAITCTSAKRKWADEQMSAMSGGNGLNLTPSSALFSPAGSAVSPRAFTSLRNSMISSPLTPGGSEKAPYICPYIKMNPNNKMHQKCRGKLYPNPRKLKEHIWQYTKPFRCGNCGEGYGRDKTRAIHIENRKIPCKPRPITEWDDKNSGRYEGSLEEERDNKIGAAKTTDEIVKILQDYERKKKLAASGGDQAKADAMQGFRVPVYAGQVSNGVATTDGGVPRITVQAYDVQGFSAGGMNFIPTVPTFTQASGTAASASQPTGLETQGWRPMPTLPCTAASTTTVTPQTPARKAKANTLSPPTPQSQFKSPSTNHNNNTVSDPRSTKSPTPELSNLCPSPASSHSSSESEHSIYDSPMYTPSININCNPHGIHHHITTSGGNIDIPGGGDPTAGMPVYWGATHHQLQHQHHYLGASDHLASALHGDVHSTGGAGISADMGIQRRSTNGSLDGLTYALMKETKDFSNYNFGNGY